MKHLIILCLSIFTVNLGFAQECGEPPVAVPGTNTPVANVSTSAPSRYLYEVRNAFAYSATQNFENLSYIPQAQFQNARISLNGNPTIVSARFNPMTSQLQIKDKDKVYNIVKTNNLQITFLSSNLTYKAKSYKGANGEVLTDYFVFDGPSTDTDLLKKIEYKHIQAKMASNSYGVNKPAKLKEIESYYVMDHNDRLVSLSTKKKSILKDFPDNSELILAFIKDNKIRNKEDNLKVLANYISSLNPKVYDETLVASN